MEAGVEL